MSAMEKKNSKGSKVLGNIVEQLSSKNEEEISQLKRRLNKIMVMLDESGAQNSEETDSEQTQSLALQSLKASVSSMLAERFKQAEKNLQEASLKAVEKMDASIKATMERIQDQNVLSENFILNADEPTLCGSLQRRSTQHNYHEKIFTAKDSLISILFKNREEFKTLYNICLACMIFLLINLLCQEYFETGKFFDFDTLVRCFQGYPNVARALFSLTAYTYLVIPLVKIIINLKLRFFVWGVVYIPFQLGIYVYATSVCENEGLNFGTSFVMMCESMRLSMKIHSYLRNKVLYCSGENNFKDFIPKEMEATGVTKEKLQRPELSMRGLETEVKQFTYFLISPTLIYRDNYPKLKTVNLKLVVIHLMNFLLCIYYTFIIYQSFVKELIDTIRENSSSRIMIILSIFRAITPATVTFFCMFFGVLHSWMNMWAELLRFPDRNFYREWWNSLEFGSFYRNWFVPGYEFLYHYVYMDIVRFSRERISRGKAKILTLLLSAGFHELIITYANGFFFPILFVIFVGPGILLMQQGKGMQRRRSAHKHNTTFWILMFFGMGLIMFLYLMESQARIVVPEQKMIKEFGLFGKFLPRSLLFTID